MLLSSLAVLAADSATPAPRPTIDPTIARLAEIPSTNPATPPRAASLRTVRTAQSAQVSTNLTISWRHDPDAVDARIIRQPLSRVLKQLSKSSGWRVFIEPGSESTVTTAFRNQPPTEAVRRILSDFNFALVDSGTKQPRLLVFRSDARLATEEVEASPESRVDEEVIVTIKPGSNLTPEELAKLTGGEIAGKIDALNAVRLRFGDAEAAEAARKKLEGIDGVGVEDNHRVPNVDSAGLIEGLAAASTLSIQPATVATGRLVIGLIDSVVQPINPSYDAFLIGRDSVVPSQSSSPELSHGTSMFAHILKAAEATSTGSGTSPNFGVLAIDVYGGNESTTAYDVALGIQRAVERGANVINLSLSSNTDSPLLHSLIQTYNSRGVLFLAAAGNDPIINPTFPASYPEVLAVTAGTASGQVAPYANRGAFVDLMLPGTGIVPYAGDQWMVSGTSTATAYASGIAGALWTPGIGSPANLNSILVQRFGVRAP